MPREPGRFSPEPKQCKAKKKNGEQCQAWAIRGGTVCRVHGGMAPAVQRKAQERIEKARAEITLAQAMQEFNLDESASPGQTLLKELSHAGQVAAWLRNKVAELPENEAAGLMKTSEKYDEETGAWTYTYMAGANVWLKLYAEWTDRASKMAKMALDAGIAERQVRVMEQHASMFANALFGVLSDLGIEMNDETRAIVRRHMMTLDAEVIEED